MALASTDELPVSERKGQPHSNLESGYSKELESPAQNTWLGNSTKNLLLFHLAFAAFTVGMAFLSYLKENYSKINHPMVKVVKIVSAFLRYLTYSSFQKYLKFNLASGWPKG